MQNKYRILITSAMLALLAACATMLPVNNVINAPVVANRAVTQDDVKSAITRAGAQLGWQMVAVKPGLITGTIQLRQHTAAIDVTYDTKTYSIKYKDSTNLNYNGSTIHKNYNGWIQNLDKGIRVQLMTL